MEPQDLGVLDEENDFAVVCDARGTQLRITRVEHLNAPPFTVLGWPVTDPEPA